MPWPFGPNYSPYGTTLGLGMRAPWQMQTQRQFAPPTMPAPAPTPAPQALAAAAPQAAFNAGGPYGGLNAKQFFLANPGRFPEQQYVQSQLGPNSSFVRGFEADQAAGRPSTWAGTWGTPGLGHFARHGYQEMLSGARYPWSSESRFPLPLPEPRANVPPPQGNREAFGFDLGQFDVINPQGQRIRNPNRQDQSAALFPELIKRIQDTTPQNLALSNAERGQQGQQGQQNPLAAALAGGSRRQPPIHPSIQNLYGRSPSARDLIGRSSLGRRLGLTGAQLASRGPSLAGQIGTQQMIGGRMTPFPPMSTGAELGLGLLGMLHPALGLAIGGAMATEGRGLLGRLSGANPVSQSGPPVPQSFFANAARNAMMPAQLGGASAALANAFRAPPIPMQQGIFPPPQPTHMQPLAPMPRFF